MKLQRTISHGWGHQWENMILDIDQEKYLALVRRLLMQAVDKSITRWHQELND